VILDRSGKVRYIHHGYKPGEESEYQDQTPIAGTGVACSRMLPRTFRLGLAARWPSAAVGLFNSSPGSSRTSANIWPIPSCPSIATRYPTSTSTMSEVREGARGVRPAASAGGCGCN